MCYKGEKVADARFYLAVDLQASTVGKPLETLLGERQMKTYQNGWLSAVGDRPESLLFLADSLATGKFLSAARLTH